MPPKKVLKIILVRCDAENAAIEPQQYSAPKPDRSLECPHCTAWFKDEEILSRHLSKYSGKNVYSRPQCPPKLTNKTTLSAHHLHFECVDCGHVFRQKRHLLDHVKRHFGEKAYGCPQCPAMFRLIPELRAHLTTHSVDRLHTCTQCAVKFKKKNELARHMIKHSNDRPYSCRYCPKAFKTSEGLKNHLTTHPVGRSHLQVCLQCTAVLKRESDLMKSVMIHSTKQKVGEKPFLCSQCPLKFSRTNHLRDHLATHSSERRLKCPHCPARFKLKRCLLKHIGRLSAHVPFSCRINSTKKTHLSGRPSCLHCHKKFKSTRTLKRHLILHSDTEKMYNCEHCVAKFRSKYHLGHHIATHSNERPHSCQYCQKNFKCKEHLKKHLIVHSKERRLEKNVAQYNPDNHAKDIKTRSIKGVYSCALCSAKFKTESELFAHAVYASCTGVDNFLQDSLNSLI